MWFLLRTEIGVAQKVKPKKSAREIKPIEYLPFLSIFLPEASSMNVSISSLYYKYCFTYYKDEDFEGHDLYEKQAAISFRVALELTEVALDFLQCDEGRGDGLDESSLLFQLHSHQCPKAIKRVSN